MLYTQPMERYHSLLLTLWREACRHIEINKLLARITSMLVHALPVEQIAFYCVEPLQGQPERLSYVSLTSPQDIPPQAVIEAAQISGLAAWCANGIPEQFLSSAPPPAIPSAMLAGMDRHVMAIPLASAHGTLGLMLMGNPRSAFSQREEQLAALLREPMAVALENDRRLHELVALREAAEADKRKLLHRLGRAELTNEIIGAENGLRAVMDRVKLVLRSDVPVLIFGETGSGKEVIARAIHDGSLRSNGPFIRVNCGAIPPELIDSELFGHERGSFTGAVASRKGWFERADGGTLFLDEIGELPAAAQVRLLRVLQDSMFERVGGEKPLHVNVRIIAATHRDLARMVQDQNFREDLWYRIAVFPIVLPPLRERKQDIPALAFHFAERASRRFGLRLQLPSQEDIELLCAYAWPGNVREFATVLDRAAILGDGKCLETAKALGGVPSAGTAALGIASQGASESEFRSLDADSEILSLDAAMRRHIERALIQCHGRIEGTHGAAAALAINPHTLRARMRKLHIKWQDYRRNDGTG